jgi:hypothetical protein
MPQKNFAIVAPVGDFDSKSSMLQDNQRQQMESP